MLLKRLLIIIPSLSILALLQSFVWVPTYDKQSAGNPNRLRTYVEASIGDAKILNPTLNADTASSGIVALVFDGLLDYDDKLALRGRLATDWQVTEEAYLLVNPGKRLANGALASGAELMSQIQRALDAGKFPELKKNIREMRLLPAENRPVELALPENQPGGKGKFINAQIAVQLPERVAFFLNEVDQDFFTRLKPLLGEGYFDGFPYDKHVSVKQNGLLEKLRPLFGEILPVGEHNPVILFNLRKGVRFHDGHEFDARDVKFTYDAIMNRKNLSPRTSDFEPIKDIQILDPHKVRVVYKRLFSPAIYAWTMGILPEHLLNDGALKAEMDRRGLSAEARAAFGMRDSDFNRRPIGTGPFQFVEWQTDEFIRLKRNQDYWEGPPEYSDYYFRIVPDQLTQEVEFRAGAIDYYGAQPHQVARYKQDESYQSFSSLGFGYSYIGYNMRNPLFADPRVRRALGMAVNVDEIIKYLLYGEGSQVTGPFPQNTEWYNPNVKALPYDPEGARHLLAQAGWKPGGEGWLVKDGKVLEFNLITNSGNPIRKNIMTIVQNAWRKIGVKCNTQYFEWAVFLKDFINTGSFDATILGWSMGIDPDIYQIFHSSQAGPQQLNFVGYNNPKADELILRIRQEYDRERQRELTYELHRVIAEDQPYTFLFVGLATRVLDKKIVIVERTPEGKERYVKIFPTQGGNITYYFNKWRKLEFTPDF
ncbi:MAG TPA: peptide-binding protein [Candidatus Binatia bacterium]|jgi:ABC-type transport system substrate-binding protein